jgi:hypothetical protein
MQHPALFGFHSSGLNATATNAVASCFLAQFHWRGLTKATNAASSILF